MGKEQGEFKSVVAEFKQMVQFKKWGGIKGLTPSGDWQQVGEIYPNKISAINKSHGLFLKMYPPDDRSSAGYAQKAWETFQELGQLTDLQLPVLTPLALFDGVLVFKKGKHKLTLHFGELEQSTQGRINNIVKKNGLYPLFALDKIEIVTVDGIDYLIDPFEDSVYQINEYAEGLRENHPD